MALKQSAMIEVKRIKGKGRGVFALRAIVAGEIIEQVPVLVLDRTDVEDEDSWTGLAGYCFEWGKGKVALALGYGSLYNHSYQPNALYEDSGKQTKTYRAIRNIAAAEEITINYNGEPHNETPVGFDVIEASAEKVPPAPKRR